MDQMMVIPLGSTVVIQVPTSTPTEEAQKLVKYWLDIVPAGCTVNVIGVLESGVPLILAHDVRS